MTREHDFEVLVESDVMVTARDGVKLATDVHRPAVAGTVVDDPLPVIVHRTPYEKSSAHQGYAGYFARHGYAVVVQDVRGCFGSQGTLDLLVNEATDGFDTMEWVVEQPWSNGRIGTWGNSYAGFTQLAAATQNPPGLVSMVPYQCAADAWVSSVRHQGALELRWLAWAFWHSATNSRADLRAKPWVEAALNLGAPSVGDWLTRLPLRRGATQLALTPEYEDWLLRLIDHADGDGWWENPSLAPVRYLDNFPDCSILLLGSWYDSYARSTVELFDAMQDYDHIDARLVMGPWVHGASSAERSVSGDIDLGPDATIKDLRAFHLRWFDETLRDGQPSHEPPIRLFVMGGGRGVRTAAGNLAHGGRWQSLTSWPPSGSAEASWYLHGKGCLDPSPPEQAVEAEGAATTYLFDPGRPVPSIGGNVSSLAELADLPRGAVSTEHAGGSVRIKDVVAPGGFDQVERAEVFGCEPPYLPLASRHDVVAFRSAPLATDVKVVRGVTAVLYVSTDAPDTDVTAKLIDEYPPSAATPHGYALNLTDSIVRLRYRNSRTPQFVAPGTVVEVRVTLYPTANVFAAGHRIRLDVSSSNFPRFDVNPNTGRPVGTHRQFRTALVTVHHCGPYPSRLELATTPVAVA